MEPFIEIKNLSYEIDCKKILDDISIDFTCEEFISLMGENGCGKTTFCKIIMGILKVNRGDVFIEKTPINNLKLYEIGRKIGYLLQNPTHQIFTNSIEEELNFGAKFRNEDSEIVKNKMRDIINKLDLNDQINTSNYLLSQGEKQRLAIGTILMDNPKFLILDEPTTGLDYKRKEKLGEILKEIHRSGVGIIVVSHDLKFAKKYSKKIINIKDGKIRSENLY